MSPGPERVVLVTGGGRGIGAACARRAAQAGYDVCIGYHAQGEAAEAVVAECRAWGRRALAVHGDVSDEAAVLTLFARVRAELGPPSVLINNAGIVAEQSPLSGFSAARVRRVLEVNVLGAFSCAREAVRSMSTRLGGGGGSIVNCSGGR
jgi:NAD(P)-dependent dehydrogenase (short-subunit alcohol dehydrogenase family)